MEQRDRDFPFHPDHPDFERLAALVEEIDERAGRPRDRDERAFSDLVKELELDPWVAAYVAGERATITAVDVPGHEGFLPHLAASWLEGLVVGTRLGRAEEGWSVG
jgi:hypothetical protein